MPRNRVIYQSEAVYAGVASVGGACTPLRRVQSCNYNFSIERTDVNQFGELAAIDRLILQEPTVSVDLSYIFEPSATNEGTLGLSNGTTGTNYMLSGIITNTGDPSLNIIIETSAAGTDANDTAATSLIGIGNAFLTSWSLEAAVGGLPTVTCAFEGQNIAFSAGTTFASSPSFSGDGTTPYTTPSVPGASILFDSATQISAIKPGDVSLTLHDALDTPGLGLLESDLKVQSVTVAMTMSREPLRKLGKRAAFSRELTFPITCTVSVNAVVGDIVTAKLSDIFNNTSGDANSYNCTIALVGYIGATPTTKTFKLAKAKLNSQNITSSIGPNKSVTLELSAQVGKDSGLFMY